MLQTQSVAYYFEKDSTPQSLKIYTKTSNKYLICNYIISINPYLYSKRSQYLFYNIINHSFLTCSSIFLITKQQQTSSLGFQKFFDEPLYKRLVIIAFAFLTSTINFVTANLSFCSLLYFLKQKGMFYLHIIYFCLIIS